MSKIPMNQVCMAKECNKPAVLAIDGFYYCMDCYQKEELYEVTAIWTDQRTYLVPKDAPVASSDLFYDWLTENFDPKLIVESNSYDFIITNIGERKHGTNPGIPKQSED